MTPKEILNDRGSVTFIDGTDLGGRKWSVTEVWKDFNQEGIFHVCNFDFGCYPVYEKDLQDTLDSLEKQSRRFV